MTAAGHIIERTLRPEPDTVPRALHRALTQDGHPPAVHWQGQQTSRAELWNRAGAWATALRQAEVRPGDLVGVCLPRTPELIAALIGVHRAGAGYVPVDPAYPRDRISFILADSACRVVITDASTSPLLFESPARQVQPTYAGAVTASTTELAVDLPDPQSLSHLIYTSGSTGTPKGVAIEHRQVMPLLRWARDCYSPAELSGVLASTSICFDLSVFEILGTLAAGGAIVLAENALAVPSLPDRDRITLINTVPSAIGTLLRTGGLPANVRTVNLAGEPLRRRLADAVLAQPGVRRLLNLYGPSEDTTYSTWAEIVEGTAEPPIGVPLPGTTAYLLDETGQPTPAGDTGELYLAGDSLAQGYLHRPGLTAERFLTAPEAPGQRMYRTGDLARIDDAGQLHYVGRVDNQVKIRGYRVELEEIDAALLRDTEITLAATVAQEDPRSGALALVAFVQLSDDTLPERARGSAGQHPVPSRILDRLLDLLPHYLIPARVVPMAELPLTPNGKVDRSRLPEVDLAGMPLAAKSKTVASPAGQASDSLERAVAQSWADVLGLRYPVPAGATFAQLGGNSLLVAAVVSRLVAQTGRRLTLPDFPVSATVAQVAARLRSTLPANETAPEVGWHGTGSSYPPAPAQLEFWVSDTVSAPLAISVMPLLFRVDGKLDLAVLNQALDQLVHRHEVLRTRITSDGQAVIAEPAPVPLDQVSSRADLEALAKQPLSLQDGPLLAAGVASSADSAHLLLLRLHHAAGDGMSISLLIVDLSQVYAALLAGQQPPPVAPLSFGDCAAWLHGARERAEAEHAEYWRQRLAGKELHTLPATRPGARDRRLARTGSRVTLRLPAGLESALARFCQHHGVTEHVALSTLTALRVRRETGANEFLLRSPVSNRRRPEFEQVIGPFLETALLPVQLDGHESFAGACTRVAGTVAKDLEHAWAETALVNGVSGLTRMANGAPIGQLLVAVQTYARAEHAAGGIGWTYLEELDNGTAKADLGFFWELNVSGGALLSIEYDDQLHTADAVHRLAGQLFTLLQAALAEPELPVHGLRWISEQDRALIERHQVGAGVGTDRVHTATLTTPARVLQAAAGHLDHVAVDCPRAGKISYAELIGAAHQFAGALTGLPATAPVAVALPRSAAGIAAMLGVWLSGRPYLPLDPAHPVQRLRAILEDSGAVALAVDEQYRQVIADGLALRLLAAPRPGEVSPTNGHSPTRLPVPDASRGADPAYLIYTSGSTGRPKGVQISHRALASFLEAIASPLPMGTGEVVAAATTPSFDISGLEMWLPLSHGATVGVITDEDTHDGQLLAHRLQQLGVSVLQLTPSGWGLLLTGNDQLDLSAVRALVGAEAVSPALAATLAQRCRQAWNVYGPTETTIWACLHRIRSGDGTDSACHPAGTVPVGTPLGNTRAYVLDSDGQLAPPGVTGEIHLTGSSLADGYHGLPGLTADAFGPLEVLDHSPRGYRTGDLGQLDSEGLLHCLGRSDNQVKVRGVRIELEEVDAALGSLPGVQAAAARVGISGPADGQLIGYVVPTAECTGAAGRAANDLASFAASDPAGPRVPPADQIAQWRAAAGQRVPSAMVPTLWLVLPALPLNTNGKVDRKALPEPNLTGGHLGATSAGVFLGELSEMEEFVAETWAEVLPVAPGTLTPGASFFDLGGHSLSATRAVAALRDDLAIELTVRTLFTEPTLRGFAGAIEDLLVAAEATGE